MLVKRRFCFDIPSYVQYRLSPGVTCAILFTMNVSGGFIPDRDPPAYYPLRGHLRRTPAGVAAQYLAALTAPGDLVVDPFAGTSTIARVAASMGRRVIAVESNPLWSWLTRTMANLPAAAEINAALARLGDALKDDVPLRMHINRMYATVCAACHEPTPADYFLHVREAGPVQRHYTCAACGETRDDPATEDDLHRAAAFDAHGLHYHIAFARVVPAENQHADRIRKMLDLYTPRNLDALVTLTTKIDALFRQPLERDILLLLLLHVLDRGTSFYVHPAPDAPAQLTVHKQFVEFNLWREMEAAARALGESAPDPIAGLVDTTAEALSAPSAFVGRGSAKALLRTVPEQSAALVLTAPPVRRLAIWTLSYFWAAWILGRPAAEPLVAALDPHKTEPQWERRWYFDMMVGAMDAVAKLLRLDAHAVFLFGETGHDAIESLLLAAAGARLNLEAFVFQPRLGDAPRREFDAIAGDYRIDFVRRKVAPLQILAEPQLAEKIRTAALAAGREVLTRRGEPLAYSWVHHAALVRAFREGYLAQLMSANTKLPPPRFVSFAMREGLTEGYAHDLDHFQAPDQFVWLRHIPQESDDGPPRVEPPLLDRVDDAVCEILATHRSMAVEELQDRMYEAFHGDLTPEAGLIELCAEAYADRDDGTWHWRSQDLAREKAHALALLERLGERLEYRIGRSVAAFDVVWERDGEMAHGFVWRDRARLDELRQMLVAPAHGGLIVPETQVALARERIRRLPLLAEAFREAGWDVIRVPYVEKLLEADKIERNDVLLITGLIPPVAGERTQLELF